MIVRRKKILSKKLLKEIVDYAFSYSERNKDYVTLFANKIAEYLGVKYAALVSSGREALKFILEYFDFPERSEIIIPVYTHKSLPIIIKNMGYKPVFVDIDERTCNIDSILIEEKITDKTVLIVATHLFGIPSDMDKILSIAAKYNLKVIEDCAQSLGATYKGRKVGALSEASFFSLAPTKSINTFGGGIVASNNQAITTFIKRKTTNYPCLRRKIIIKVIITLLEDIITHSLLYSFLGFLFYFDFTKRIFARTYKGFHHSIRNINSKYLNFQAYLGYRGLLEIDRRNKLMMDKINKFRSFLVKEIDYPKANYPHTLDFNLNIVRTKYSCDQIRKELIKRGIDVGIKDEVTDNCSLYFGKKEDFPSIDKIYETLIEFPLSWEFTDKLIFKIADKLNKTLKYLS